MSCLFIALLGCTFPVRALAPLLAPSHLSLSSLSLTQLYVKIFMPALPVSLVLI